MTSLPGSVFRRREEGADTARNTDWLRPGEHVIVTGGSSGIGLALAEEFAARGAVVSLLARGAGRLSSAADALRRQGSRCTRGAWM